MQGLRSSTILTNELVLAIRALGEELAADQNTPSIPDFQVQVEGSPCDLSPLVRDDFYNVACEAVRNAFRHAHASQIHVEIRYDSQQLRLRVRDNGKGIEPQVLETGARAGHYGLPGLCERAKLVGGKLLVRSEPGNGTLIQLTIPASVGYAKSGPTHPVSSKAVS